MKKKVQTTISEIKLFWQQASVNAFEGAVFGAFAGSVLSGILAGVIWVAHVGLFGGAPAGGDIAFGLGMGFLNGSLAGATYALVECAINPNLFLNPLPSENQKN